MQKTALCSQVGYCCRKFLRRPGLTLEKAMKLTFLLLIVALGVSARSVSQTVTFSGKDVPLQKVFAAVKKQTGYLAVYDYDLVLTAKPVTLSVYNMSLTEFLDMVLRDQPLKYVIDKRTILITGKPLPAKVVAAPPGVTSDQPDAGGRINGTVLNATTKEPLAGASVVLKGTKFGTSTTVAGKFSIVAQSAGETMVISSLGYATVSIKVAELLRLKE
ncbi:MAG TPA: carboxypeptidase-like regulatory domain-containing protein, partial [Puia sp.]|nr:carboxypeptidase-like regulatory domain-containing protein [Puia sp.]